MGTSNIALDSYYMRLIILKIQDDVGKYFVAHLVCLCATRGPTRKAADTATAAPPLMLANGPTGVLRKPGPNS